MCRNTIGDGETLPFRVIRLFRGHLPSFCLKKTFDEVAKNLNKIPQSLSDAEAQAVIYHARDEYETYYTAQTQARLFDVQWRSSLVGQPEMLAGTGPNGSGPWQGFEDRRLEGRPGSPVRPAKETWFY